MLYDVEGSYHDVLAGQVVSVIQDNLVIDYTAHASRENRIDSLVFDAKTGGIYHLSDLFIDDYDWRDQLLLPATESYKAYCNTQGLAQDPQVLKSLQKRLTRRTPFSVDKEGLTIYVAYNDDTAFMPVTIIYKDLNVYLDKEATIWSAINK